MTKRKRLLSLCGGVLLLSACGEQVEDFIEAEGTYGDGRPLSFREQLRRYTCDSTKAEAPCVSLVALRLSAVTTEVLRGVRITYTPSKMSKEMTYPSGLFEPVTLYIVQARADRFVDSTVSGGQMQFASIAAAPGELTAGAFQDMVLRRIDDDGVEHTVLTLHRGTFQYLQP